MGYLSTSTTLISQLHIVKSTNYMRKIFVGLIILISFLVIRWYSFSESYFPIYPDIETEYADGFTYAEFQSLQAGMTKDAIRSKLGSPIKVKRITDQYECWDYSRERGSEWFDLAWISVGVCFQDGLFVDKYRTIFSD